MPLLYQITNNTLIFYMSNILKNVCWHFFSSKTLLLNPLPLPIF